MIVCPACAGSSIQDAYVVRGCTIRRCQDCGLGRTVVPRDFDPDTYYSAEYFQGGVSDGYADYVGSAAALRAEFQQTVQHVLQHCQARGHLLEFGCAYGFFLDEAAPHFSRVSGIELAVDAVESCQKRGHAVTRGVVSPSTVQGPYDAVVGLDVIEHVPEPAETIGNLADAMSPGGVLVMTTGDWGSLLARSMGSSWRLMTPPQHLSFFTGKSMQAIVERSGLDVIDISHPWKHVPLSLIAYQVQRLIGLRPRALSLPGALPVNLWDAMRVTARKRKR